MLNEHHQTATCVDPASADPCSGALARLYQKGAAPHSRQSRRQPPPAGAYCRGDGADRCAVERPASNVGFVRGVPYEVLPANRQSGTGCNERQWEAMDLIVRAWTSHDGPVSHEGRFFHHRNINIWPRPWQQPHPPIWVSTTSEAAQSRVGRAWLYPGDISHRLQSYAGSVFEAYRAGWREAGLGEDVPKKCTPVNCLLYAVLVDVGDS